ncbi:MAG TPA: hypothetical protein VF592_12435, partial [Sphingomonas sp.]
MMIANWRQSWRLWSVRVSALGAVLATTAAAAPDALISAWQSLPEEIRYVVPEHVGRWITPVLFAASLAARILKQRE